MPDLNLPKLLTPTETADRLRVSVGTLAQWRHHKRYPLAYLKIGRAVRYLESAVKAFISSGASQ